MNGCQCKRRVEQVDPFFMVVVRGFERTDVSKKGDEAFPDVNQSYASCIPAPNDARKGMN